MNKTLEPFTLIQGGKAYGKTTLIIATLVVLALFLLGSTLSELRMILLNMDLSLCDLRRRLALIPTDAQAFSFTVTAEPIPVTLPKVALSPMVSTDERTENT